MSVHRRWVRRALLCSGLTAFAGPSFAQLEEIVVTAERRATSLQQTPISIAAFTAESMELKGIETFEDVATFTPNLDIKGSRGSGNVSPTYQIRGLSGGGGATGERSAAMYIDGIYMPRTTGPFMSVLDIERIEVLRGPQGTLFGRNSTGGAIRVFTQRPGPERAGYVKLGAGNFGRADLNAMYNMPLTDTAFLRLQAASLNQDGYVRRGSQELGGSEDTLFRAQLALEPSDALTVNLNFTSTETESDGNPQDLATFDMRPNLDFEGGQADWVSDFLEAAGQPRLDPADDPRVVLDPYTMPDWCFLDDVDPDWDAACEQSNNGELDQLDMTVDWQIGDNLSLTSITGLTDFSSAGITDWVMIGTRAQPSNVESEVLYQELQLSSVLAGGRVNLVTGVSYFQEDSLSYGFDLERTGTSVYPDMPNGNMAAVGTGPNGLTKTGDLDTFQDAESWGLFANLTWDVTDALSITPGVRWAFDDKRVDLTRRNDDTWTAFAGTSTSVTAATDTDEMDWRLTLDYDITDDVMVYATSSKSFRAGALSLGMGGVPASQSAEDINALWRAAPPFTLPESVHNRELGVRAETAEGRLRINLTVYDMRYGDRQAPVAVQDPTSNTGFIITVVDSGNVDLDGVELDGQVALTDNFVFDFSGGTVDSKLYDVCANNGDFLFPGPVEESYSLGLSWSNLMSSGNRLSWSLSYAHVGEQQTHPGSTDVVANNCASPVAGWFFDSRYENPAYDLVNGRVSYASGDGRWAVSLFGNNLTDEVYANYASRFGGGFWEAGIAPFGARAPLRSALGNTMGRPREYGVSFQYNFGAAVSAAR